jgi:demethylmenaquinone methyltransferase/2-methoxy-6-polyprenyl-1,4-benzoquinol methylase
MSDSAQVWDDALLANPHAAADKRQRVQRMFAAIAPSYDLNNRLHSVWADQWWRRRAMKLANLKVTDQVVDVACGTGDLAIKFGERLHELSRRGKIPHKVLGIDFTFEMLPIARQKTPWHRHSCIDPPGAHRPYGGISTSGRIETVQWLNADALALPLPDTSADVVSIAFGIRNVADPAAALREFHRILRPGGRVVVLEFSLPTSPLLRSLYNFYFRKILPVTATLISGDKTGAYKYLPESVNTFITRERMMIMMSQAGFTQVEQFTMTFGVCVCYRGIRE